MEVVQTCPLLPLLQWCLPQAQGRARWSLRLVRKHRAGESIRRWNVPLLRPHPDPPDCHQLRRSFSRCIHRLHHLDLNLVGCRLGSGRLTARSLRVPSTLDLTVIRRVLRTKLMKERCMLKCCVAGSYQENRNSSVLLTSMRFESETAHREHFQKRVGSHCRLTFAHLSKLEVVTQWEWRDKVSQCCSAWDWWAVGMFTCLLAFQT